MRSNENHGKEVNNLHNSYLGKAEERLWVVFKVINIKHGLRIREVRILYSQSSIYTIS